MAETIDDWNPTLHFITVIGKTAIPTCAPNKSESQPFEPQHLQVYLDYFICLNIFNIGSQLGEWKNLNRQSSINRLISFRSIAKTLTGTAEYDCFFELSNDWILPSMNVVKFSIRLIKPSLSPGFSIVLVVESKFHNSPKIIHKNHDILDWVESILEKYDLKMHSYLFVIVLIFLLEKIFLIPKPPVRSVTHLLVLLSSCSNCRKAFRNYLAILCS